MHGVEVPEERFIGWPERTLSVEVADLSAVERILSSAESRKMKERFTCCAMDIQTRIVEQWIRLSKNHKRQRLSQGKWCLSK